MKPDPTEPEPTMTLPEITQAIAGLAYADSLAATNVLSVRNVGTDVEFVTDTSELAEEIASLREDLAAAEKDAADFFARVETAEDETAEVRRIIAEIKDPASGVSVKDYRERAEQAHSLAESWRKHAEKCEAELDLLRRRKGVMPGYIAEHGNVLDLLQRIAVKDATFDGPVRAAEMFTRLRRSQKGQA